MTPADARTLAAMPTHELRAECVLAIALRDLRDAPGGETQAECDAIDAARVIETLRAYGYSVTDAGAPLAQLALDIADAKAADIVAWRWTERRSLGTLTALLRDLQQALRAAREAVE